MRFRPSIQSAPLQLLAGLSVMMGTAPASVAAQEKPIGYTETGVASYYAGKFHGRLTASGERFNTNAMTAAHRKLPFGSMLRVKNLRNGEVVIVRVNDRGPYAHGRILDLSRAAAEQLKLVAQGTAPIRLELIGKEGRIYPPMVAATSAESDGEEASPKKQKAILMPPPSHRKEPADSIPSPTDEPVATEQERQEESPERQPARVPQQPYATGGTFGPNGERRRITGQYTVQAGAFSSLKNAQELAKKLRQFASQPVSIQVLPGEKADHDWYKVIVGQFKNESKARALLKELEGEGFKGFIAEPK